VSDQPEPEAKTTNVTSAASTSQGLPVKGVALLLLAFAVIVGGVIYGLASWQYRSLAELKDAIAKQQATIQNVDASLAKLREENSASLTSLRTENADLRSRLAAAESRVTTSEAAFAQSQRRDPDAIYQLGVEVGRVTGASEDRAASTITFDSIEGGNFDRGKEFDYRDLTLMVKSHQGAMTSITGRGVQTQLTGVEATIVRTRALPK
jgi:regulator of replication initiation timing